MFKFYAWKILHQNWNTKILMVSIMDPFLLEEVSYNIVNKNAFQLNLLIKKTKILNFK